MARFLKVRARHETHRREKPGAETRHINVYQIDEIGLGEPRRKLDKDGRGVDDEQGQPVYIQTTSLKIAHVFFHAGASGAKLDHAEYTVDGAPADWVRRIEKMIADDRAEAAPPQPAPDQNNKNDPPK